MYGGVQQNHLGVQKMHGNKLRLIKAPFLLLSAEGVLPHSTRLPLSQLDSAPATFQFPPATFFQFENPVF